MRSSSFLAFVGLLTAATVAACNNTVSGPPGPPPTAPPPSCVAPACVRLGSALHDVVLPSVDGIAVTVQIAGGGFVSLRDSDKPFGTSGLFAIFQRRPDLSNAVFYLKITAINGTATLSHVPGLKLVFPGKAPSGALRLATMENGVWTTVGKPGIVKDKTVIFAATYVSPPIKLKDGDSYELGVYSGGILPPTPTPSPSPKPSSSPTPSIEPSRSPSPSPSPSGKPTPSPTASPTPTPTPKPIGTPALLGFGFATLASGSTLLILTTSSAPAGASVIVIASDGGTTPATSLACADGAGNSYTTDVFRNSGGVSTAICSAHNIRALPSGSTIMETWSGQTGLQEYLIGAYSVTGLAGSALDRTAANAANSASLSSGTTATTTQAHELLFGVVSYGSADTSFAPGGNGTSNVCSTSGTSTYTSLGLLFNGPALGAMYCVVNATGAYAATGSKSFAEPWIDILATYKGAP